MKKRPGPRRPRYLPKRRYSDLLPLVDDLCREEKIEAEQEQSELRPGAVDVDAAEERGRDADGEERDADVTEFRVFQHKLTSSICCLR